MKKLVKSEVGAAMVEYVLMVCTVALLIVGVGGGSGVGPGVSGVFDRATLELNGGCSGSTMLNGGDGCDPNGNSPFPPPPPE